MRPFEPVASPIPLRRSDHTRSPSGRIGRLVHAVVIALALCLVISGPASAVDGLTMEARPLLDGNAKTGRWMAIDVHLVNAGPPISGELRLTGGAGGKTSFALPVDLPTQSDKVYRLYSQPQPFGREVVVTLVSGDQTVATSKVEYKLRDPTQLVVGVVAERPGDIVGSVNLLPNQNGFAPMLVALGPDDLPARVEAWGALDRLIWQDVDAGRLSTEQLDALRGWVAGGGRLVIVGGTAGPSSLAAMPDALLPYRPAATVDVAPSSLGALLGAVPPGVADVPALSGELATPGGRALATSGDRVVAAERVYGSGSVTLIGFDPTADWLAGSKLGDNLWRRLIPTTAMTSGPTLSDDSQIVSAAAQLPSLALPPITGLVALLGAYILLIGPINYLVLKRLDKREWAWVTMPVLIVVFAVVAYGFGSLLRGSEIIVNEVAIVRGAPGATEGTVQAYLGVFSPSRGTYQLAVPGGALLSSPVNGDFSSGDGSAAALDVLQGDPGRVRDLGVGFGSLRTIRAESAVKVPLVTADIRLEDGRLRGTVRNGSSTVVEKPAVVLGGTVATLDDLAPGATASVDVAIQSGQFGQQLSDKVVGPVFFGDPRGLGDDMTTLYARHTIIDQLTYDPNFGFTGQLPADGPVVLAWTDEPLLDVQIAGQTPKRTGSILYFLPTDLAIRGDVTFRNDLLRSTVVSSEAGFFSKDPYSVNMGRGTAQIAYRPIAFDGSLDATGLVVGLNTGDMGVTIDPRPITPVAGLADPCADPTAEACQGLIQNGLPQVELFDLTDATWKRLPVMASGIPYAVADPGRYVDPDTGSVLVRFVNDHSDGTGFNFDVAISGSLR